MTVEERLWAKVDKQLNGCWLWTGAKDRGGYGHIGVGGKKTRLVHRVAYELTIGPIPDGLYIDHVALRGCTSRACVNPAHLEAVTPLENALRARPTHCKHGHEFTLENTHIRPNGHRACRICSRRRGREAMRRYMARRRSRRLTKGGSQSVG